jgi:hypothetical protein
MPWIQAAGLSPKRVGRVEPMTMPILGFMLSLLRVGSQPAKRWNSIRKAYIFG